MDSIPEHIAELIRSGRKIEAVKLLREETGVDLQTAKEAVDRMDADPVFDPLPVPERPEDVSDEVQSLAWEGQKIVAIKLLREQSGLALKASKEIVDLLPVDPNVPQTSAKTAIVSVMIVVFLMAVGLAMAVYVFSTTP